MLVLYRKLGEKVFIGDDIIVTVVARKHGGLQLGIEAPKDLLILRNKPETLVDVLPSLDVRLGMAAEEEYLLQRHGPRPDPDIDPASDPRRREW